MQQGDETILRLTKEIIIKFIESGRVSPTNFDESFKSIFWTIKSTVVSARVPELGPMGEEDAGDEEDEAAGQ